MIHGFVWYTVLLHAWSPLSNKQNVLPYIIRVTLFKIWGYIGTRIDAFRHFVLRKATGRLMQQYFFKEQYISCK